MKSLDLIPAMEKLPGGGASSRRSFRRQINDMLSTDQPFYAAESAIGASMGFWAIFKNVNVDDGVRETMTRAHNMAMPKYEGTLTDHWKEMMETGPDSMRGLLSPLKGKYAEIEATDTLKQNGYTNVRIAENPNQPVWDITTSGADGQTELTQVKTGGVGYSSEISDRIEQHPDVQYYVSSEIYQKIEDRVPELTAKMTDIGSDYKRVEGIKDGLNTLSANEGIDIPDAAEILPYAGAIIAGVRLIYSVIRTERDFTNIDRTTKNKIQVMQTLTLMSRMGVNTVLATVGGAGGAYLGTVLPGPGNLVGGITGTIAGAGMGMHLNRRLQPRMLSLALDIMDITHDDLFYYKNKQQIDDAALSFRQSAVQLEALNVPQAQPAIS